MAECDHCGEHEPRLGALLQRVRDGAGEAGSRGPRGPKDRHDPLLRRRGLDIARGSDRSRDDTPRDGAIRGSDDRGHRAPRRNGRALPRGRGDGGVRVPVAHEDDALRAVRAATAMQRRLAELNAELRGAWGVELACRIGINTGEVVAGDPGTGETFVTGDAVNLAKRLEQAAEPGTILIGTATYPLVKDAVKVGPRERFSAKGKSEPVARFRVDEVDDAAAGYARRLDAPLVNRDDELDDAPAPRRATRLPSARCQHRHNARAGRDREVPARAGARDRARGRRGRRDGALPPVRQRHHLLAAAAARHRPRRDGGGRGRVRRSTTTGTSCSSGSGR